MQTDILSEYRHSDREHLEEVEVLGVTAVILALRHLRHIHFGRQVNRHQYLFRDVQR